MAEEKLYRKIRVFVASPGDVNDERDGLIDIIREINQTGSFADDAGLFFELLDWRTHAIPMMGRPEDIILDQIPVNKWDIFIGIMWSKFGTPPGVNPELDYPLEGGTEEEFLLAHRSWLENKRPVIHFFRCTRPLPYKVNPSQLSKVNEFFNKFEKDEKYKGFYSSYQEIPDFLNKVKQLLNYYVKKYSDNSKKEEALKKIVPKEYGPGERLDAELKPENPYEIVFLSIAIRPQCDVKEKTASEKLQHLSDNIRNLVYETSKAYKGDQFQYHRSGFGGIMAFWGDDAYNRAALVGIKLLNLLPIVNLDINFNPLDQALEIFITGHAGEVTYHIPKYGILSAVLTDLENLEKDATPTNTFTISNIFYFQLKDKLQRFFLYNKKEFQNYTLYFYKGILPLTKKKDEKEETDYLEKVKIKVNTETSEFIDTLVKEMKGQKNKREIEKLQRQVAEIYKFLEEFGEEFSNLDKRWRKEYFLELEECLGFLIKKEELFYEEVEKLCLQWSENTTVSPPLLTLAEFLGHIRINSYPSLKVLLNQVKQRLNDEIDLAQTPKQVFSSKIESLIKSDEFEEESNFIELFMNFRTELVDYVLHNQDDQYYPPLLERLWKLVDFIILLEDIGSPHAVTQDKWVLWALTGTPNKGNHFKLIQSLISQKVIKPDLIYIREQCNKFEVKETKENLVLILKCMLLSPTFRDQSNDILEQINVNELWNIISYNKTRLRIIYAINKRITLMWEAEKVTGVTVNTGTPISNPSDLMKVFFDLTYVRMEKEVESLEDVFSFGAFVKMIINFFKFDFFVYDGYFERLNNLRLSVIARKRSAIDIDDEYLDGLMREIEDERNRRVGHRANSPEGVLAMPKAIQRRLVINEFYLEKFIFSKNDIIFFEAVKHIKQKEISALLRESDIPDGDFIKIFGNLLAKRKDIFNIISTTYVTLLTHPKCTMEIAGPELKDLEEKFDNQKKLIKPLLTKIANHTDANPEIRAEAGEILKRKGGTNKS